MPEATLRSAGGSEWTPEAIVFGRLGGSCRQIRLGPPITYSRRSIFVPLRNTLIQHDAWGGLRDQNRRDVVSPYAKRKIEFAGSVFTIETGTGRHRAGWSMESNVNGAPEAAKMNPIRRRLKRGYPMSSGRCRRSRARYPPASGFCSPRKRGCRRVDLMWMSYGGAILAPRRRQRDRCLGWTCCKRANCKIA